MEWSLPPHNDVKVYIRSKQQSGLVQEFKSESEFKNAVCRYVTQYAQAKEDAIASVLQDTITSIEGDLLPAETDILIGAILEACGYKKEGSEWIKAGIILALLAVGVPAIISLLSRKK